MQTNIDCYGYRNDIDVEKYKNPAYAKQAHLVEETSDGVFICFSDTSGDQPIHKITTVNGLTTIAWAYGAWADRATLDYDLPLSTTRTINI